MNYYFTNEQARRFILLKHGFIGDYKFEGKKGVLDYIAQAGCIQFDPIDVCGKNPELVLQSRVKDFNKKMLWELLYKDRELIDFFDKNLSIMATSDWKYFSRYRNSYKNHVYNSDEVKAAADEIKKIIADKGAVCSNDIGLNKSVDWYWNKTRLSRAALETLYFCGELVVHHKTGSIKHYDLAENCISSSVLNEVDPHADDFDFKKWLVLRRIGSVGLLWNKPSDAWLGISDLKADVRKRVFDSLINEHIVEVTVENVKDKLYFVKSDIDIADYILKSPKLKERCEFIAPLDNMMWDRKLIKQLFGFDYKWEIYTPEANRKYGYYVLPVLYGDRFVARIEAVNDRKNKTLVVKNIWLETGVRQTKKLDNAIKSRIEKFAVFNDTKSVMYHATINETSETHD